MIEVLLISICLFVCLCFTHDSQQSVSGNAAVWFKMAPGRFLKKKREEKKRRSVTSLCDREVSHKHQQVFWKQLGGGLEKFDQIKPLWGAVKEIKASIFNIKCLRYPKFFMLHVMCCFLSFCNGDQFEMQSSCNIIICFNWTQINLKLKINKHVRAKRLLHLAILQLLSAVYRL